MSHVPIRGLHKTDTKLEEKVYEKFSFDECSSHSLSKIKGKERDQERRRDLVHDFSVFVGWSTVPLLLRWECDLSLWDQ